MNKRDELIALIDAYAHHVRGWQRIDPTYRENIITTLDAALTPGEPVMIYHGRCVVDCGEHGHHDVEMLKMVPAGTKLYTTASPSTNT